MNTYWRSSVVLILLLVLAPKAEAGVVYSEDFDAVIGPEWSATTAAISPVGGRRFLGEFYNDTVSLTLSGLPAHSTLTLDLDLYVLKSWDGNYFDPIVGGVNEWDVAVVDGPTLLRTTFSNVLVNPVLARQAYPGSFPGSDYPGQTGASEVNTLGYTLNGVHADAVYPLQFSFLHSSESVTFHFSAAGLNGGIADESWGMDNVRVSSSPGPVFGDSNGDNVVDLDDLNNVRNHFGEGVLLGPAIEGEAYPFDGIVDLGDLNHIRNYFGTGTAVPEPASVMLLALGVGAAALRRRIAPRNSRLVG